MKKQDSARNTFIVIEGYTYVNAVIATSRQKKSPQKIWIDPMIFQIEDHKKLGLKQWRGQLQTLDGDEKQAQHILKIQNCVDWIGFIELSIQ